MTERAPHGATQRATERITVTSSARLYVGGAFAGSESGRTYALHDPAGRPLGSAALGSRKDVRDAVAAARAASAGWAGTAPMARGQALYRVAAQLESRATQLAAEVAAAEGLGAHEAAGVVAAAVDRWVWYAGWADKIPAVAGGVNAVAGAYVSWTVPVPGGVVGAVAPQESSLLGLVGVLAPALAAGAGVVVLASELRPLPALTVAGCAALAGLPPGCVNVLTGRTAELAPTLATHGGVDALDLAGAGPAAADLAAEAAATLKRVHPGADPDPGWAADPDLARLLLACELTTVWGTAGG